MRCPHCNHIILSDAQMAVARHARKAQTISALAWTYARFRPALTYLSCRRAVERMAHMKILVRVKPGIYRLR